MYSHCTTGGWILGNRIDGTQAEYVRTPHADTSLYAIPEGLDEEGLVMLSDILPTGFECGVLNGKVQPGSTVAIVGAGPVGLAALLTAQFYSPAQVILIDLDDNRLAVARRFGATHTVNSSDEKEAVAKVKQLTAGRGVDTAMEAVGIPATFGLCEQLVAAGGTIASVRDPGDRIAVDHGRDPVSSLVDSDVRVRRVINQDHHERAFGRRGVSKNPARMSTPSRTTSSCANRLATSGAGPPTSLRMISIFLPATVSPCCFM